MVLLPRPGVFQILLQTLPHPRNGGDLGLCSHTALKAFEEDPPPAKYHRMWVCKQALGLVFVRLIPGNRGLANLHMEVSLYCVHST